MYIYSVLVVYINPTILMHEKRFTFCSSIDQLKPNPSTMNQYATFHIIPIIMQLNVLL